MTVKGGTSPACAACKYQRRKCASDCVLAPYFPANQPKMFQNAHRLFGISNITKILKQLDDEDQKADAMKSIIFEADMRERFPVYGCVEYICYLRQQLQQTMDELHYVYTQLAVCKEQQLLGSVVNSHNNNNSNNYDHQQHTTLLQPYGINNAAEMSYPMNVNLFGAAEDDMGEGESSESVGKPNLLGVEPSSYYEHPTDVLVKNTNYNGHMSLPSFPNEHSQDYGLVAFNNTIADDRQSYIEMKETCESSSESSFKDTTQSNEELSRSELKNAAAYFSLTS
ncbi:LOB domain-containing protein 27-like [Ipomoea triloba]|uniref:LOB domain-containing protein 27-like n=1 Tax=Ipomoea triloba TaxID=35885 RepID=UPI00125DB01D|nr:LOB domain-containing protein 27-like [Ipomoea triloba]